MTDIDGESTELVAHREQPTSLPDKDERQFERVQQKARRLGGLAFALFILWMILGMWALTGADELELKVIITDVPFLAWDPVHGATAYQIAIYHVDSGGSQQWIYSAAAMCKLVTVSGADLCGVDFHLPQPGVYWMTVSVRLQDGTFTEPFSTRSQGWVYRIPSRPCAPMMACTPHDPTAVILATK